MPSIEDQFTEIGNLLARAERKLPQEKLTALMRQMAPSELHEWHAEIRRLIDEFRPKRRRDLLEVLESGTSDDVPRAPGAETASLAREPVGSYAAAIDARLIADFMGRAR